MKTTGYEMSDCCGASVDTDRMICFLCKEHCGIEYECGNCGDFVKKVDDGGFCQDCHDNEMKGQIYG